VAAIPRKLQGRLDWLPGQDSNLEKPLKKNINSDDSRAKTDRIQAGKERLNSALESPACPARLAETPSLADVRASVQACRELDEETKAAVLALLAGVKG
jgi:hypothetical protein